MLSIQYRFSVKFTDWYPAQQLFDSNSHTFCCIILNN